MVMVVGILTLIVVSMVASIAYTCGFDGEMTKLVCCDEWSLRTWEMMYAPSGVGCSVGVALRWSGVASVRDARKELAISMPWVSAWWRYP